MLSNIKNQSILDRICCELFFLGNKGWNPTKLYLGTNELDQLAWEIYSNPVYNINKDTQEEILRKLKTGKFKLWELSVVPSGQESSFDLEEKYN